MSRDDFPSVTRLPAGLSIAGSLVWHGHLGLCYLWQRSTVCR